MIALLVAAELVVFAASSLREAFQQLASSFEQRHRGAHVALNLAGSQELRVQIENGAAADVFASADLRQMQALQELAVAPRIFARNVPVLVVPPGNPAGLTSFPELPKARRIVLGAAEVPIGAYSERILEMAGVEFRRRVEERVVSRELNVRQVLAKVALGEADAAIVYRTDAQAGAGKVQMLEIPGAPVAEYPIAPLARAPHPDLARQFVELVLSPAGQRVLESFGFQGPP